MKKLFLLLFLISSINLVAQKDSLQVLDKYLEDQVYLSISYNTLFNQPAGVADSGFSYGISTGFIKDLPVNKSRTFGFGLGLGYGYDSFNYGLKVIENNNQFTFEVDETITNNKLRIHNIEFPIEVRWRNSTKSRYAFWRVYAGLKITYNFANRFAYDTPTESFVFNDIEPFNNWQTGLTFSAGYDAFNFYFYYGLTPVFNNVQLNGNPIDTKIIKFGLSFYIL